MAIGKQLRFQRRHYEAIAEMLADEHLYALNDQATLRRVEASLVLLFGRDNPRFDAERFAKACRWQKNRLAAE